MPIAALHCLCPVGVARMLCATTQRFHPRMLAQCAVNADALSACAQLLALADCSLCPDYLERERARRCSRCSAASSSAETLRPSGSCADHRCTLSIAWPMWAAPPGLPRSCALSRVQRWWVSMCARRRWARRAKISHISGTSLCIPESLFVALVQAHNCCCWCTCARCGQWGAVIRNGCARDSSVYASACHTVLGQA